MHVYAVRVRCGKGGGKVAKRAVGPGRNTNMLQERAVVNAQLIVDSRLSPVDHERRRRSLNYVSIQSKGFDNSSLPYRGRNVT